MQTPHSGRRSSAAPARRFRKPLWLAPLLVSTLLVGLVSLSTADSISLYSDLRHAANQVQAGNNTPFTCTPTGIDWGNLGRDREDDDDDHGHDRDSMAPGQSVEQVPSKPPEQPKTQPAELSQLQPAAQPQTQAPDQPKTQPVEESKVQPPEQPLTQPPEQPQTQPLEQPQLGSLAASPAHDKGRGDGRDDDDDDDGHDDDDHDDDDHSPARPETTVTCRNNGHWPLTLQLAIQNLPDVTVSPTSLVIPTESTGSALVRLVGSTPGRYTNGRLVVEGNGQSVVIPIQYCLRGRGVQCR